MQLFALTLAASLALTSAVCPNSCSGHGTCNAFDECTCFDEGKTLYFGKDADPITGQAYTYDSGSEKLQKQYTGADCSLMTCPRGMSWKDQTEQYVLTLGTAPASGVDLNGQEVIQGYSEGTITGHTDTSTSITVTVTAGKFKLGKVRYSPWTPGTANSISSISSKESYDHTDDVECSDSGLCDRSSGACQCFPGFGGSACQRGVCENDCSGHGICQSNLKFAEDGGARYHNAWDAGLHFGCKCDSGYRGGDCSLVECPSGADPLNWHGNSQGRDCSGRGICDYTTGQCQCFPGYTQKDCATVEALA